MHPLEEPRALARLTLMTPTYTREYTKTAPWSAVSTPPLTSGSVPLRVKHRGEALRASALDLEARRPSFSSQSRNGTSLTAAAARVTSSPTTGDRITRHRSSEAARGWQEEVLAAAAQIGELRYIANTTAQAASRAWVYPADAKLTQDATQAAQDDSAPGEPTAPPGTVDPEIIRRLTLLLSLIGEAYIVELPRGRGRPATRSNPGTSGYERVAAYGPSSTTGYETHILAPMDVRFADSTTNPEVTIHRMGTYRLSGPGSATVTRVHQPDTRHADEPDSAARSALPVLRELIGLSMHVSATLDSRLHAGIFVYPIDAEVAQAAAQPGVKTADSPSFSDAMTETMATAVSEPDAASRLVPILLGIPPGTDKETLKWIVSPNSGFDPNITNMRNENVRRLALGMDAPPEVMLGTGSASGFGSWSIEGEFIRLQIAPKLRLVAAALSVAYGIEYTFDTGPLVVHPNKAVEAQALYDRGVIGDATLRAAAGFTDLDAPQVDVSSDPALDLALNLVRQAPSLMQAPGLAAVVDQCRIVLGEAPKYQEYYPGAPDAPLAGSGANPSAGGTGPDQGAESSRPRSDRGPQSDNNGEPRDIPQNG